MEQNFDATKVINSRPWFEKAIEAVAPSWGLKRLEARVQRELFSYNASQTNRLYAPKTYGQPSESTMNSRSRVVMMWEARDLVENVPEAREIARKFGQYLTPNEYSPTTGDRAYNQIVAEYFHDWCKRCDISNRHSFRKLIQLAAEERPVDGDCGVAIRRVDGGDLKIQLIPATRIGNPNAIGAESDNYYQGVIVDDFMRPIAYKIYRVTRQGVYFGAEEIAASNFCHYVDPFRIDQMRGISDFHACSRTVRMLYEILEAEKAGVRFASQQAALIYTDRGAANPRSLFQPSPTQTLPNGQPQQNEFTEAGSIRYFGAADRIEVMPSRPSQAFTGFVQHLMHEIAIGVGIPEGVLFGTTDYKGPSVRAEFAAADRFFARHQGILTDKVLDPVKNAVLLNAIAQGLIPPPPMQSGESMVQALKRATKGEWRFPAKLTIDIGRESRANMDENRQGAKSLQEIAGEQGTDAFSRLEQIATEAAFVKELASKYAVPETAIRLTTANLPSTPIAATAAGQSGVVDPNASPADAPVSSETPIEDRVMPAIENATTTSGEGSTTGKDTLVQIDFATDSYVPNDKMASNAKRALEVRASKPPSQRGMTAVGLARARDISNKKSLSADTVRRMKAYFDRHEVDKKGETWGDQGKGWQAWQGWGGDAGRTWANAIVERLNKKSENSSAVETREFSAATEIAIALDRKPQDPNKWLDAVEQYRRELGARIDESVKPIVGERSLVELAEKKPLPAEGPATPPVEFVMPSPNKGEKSDDFLARCMGDAVMNKDYPDNAQRYAVCNAQLKARDNK